VFQYNIEEQNSNEEEKIIEEESKEQIFAYENEEFHPQFHH